MSQKYFVTLELGNKKFGPAKIFIKDDSDVYDFKKAIKEEFSHLLQSYDTAQLDLFESDGITKIDPETEMKDVFVEKGKPLIVKAESPVRPAISSSRHQEYKHSKAVHSSRSYLTSIAVELEKLYSLEKLKPNEPATFGDVLWNAMRRQPAPKLPNMPLLKEYFTPQEWSNLNQLNNEVNPELHAELVSLADGESKEVILPLNLGHLGPSYQRIAKKANVVSTELKLIVKNEGSVSGGTPDSDKKV